MQSSELGCSPRGKPVLDGIESPADCIVVAGFVGIGILEELCYKGITRFLIVHQHGHQ